MTTSAGVVLKKIEQLRAERDMLSFCRALSIDRETYQHIKTIISMIQYSIFELDYLMENPDMTAERLNETIHTTFMTIHSHVTLVVWSAQYTTKLLQHYRTFLDLESAMRASKDTIRRSPLDYDIGRFYSIKSCDIFLHRHLIMHLAWQESLPASVHLFDNLWEILDDMLDVEEDIDKINANRFLISLVARGNEDTCAEYWTYVQKHIPTLRNEHAVLSTYWLDVDALLTSLTNLLQKKRPPLEYSATNKLLDAPDDI
jgi:hypothetical protein